MTPPIPEWLRSFRLAGYRSIYEYYPDEPRIFGTESLYGDWNGTLLVVAKDFACSRVVEERIAKGDRAFHHKPTLKTNKALRGFVDSYTVSTDPLTCGILYGSVLGGMLRDDGQMSGTLPNRKRALAFGVDVMRFTLDCMPRLKTIVCMGEEAWLCCASALGMSESWRTCRDEGKKCCVGGYTLVAAYHPAARVSRSQHELPWSLLAN